MIKAIVINWLNRFSFSEKETDPELEASSLSRLKALRTKLEHTQGEECEEKTNLLTRVRIKRMGAAQPVSPARCGSVDKALV